MHVRKPLMGLLVPALPAALIACLATAAPKSESGSANRWDDTPITVGDSGVSFNHEAHMGQNFVCDDCHTWEKGERLVGFADVADCADCHDPEKESEQGKSATKFVQALQEKPEDSRFSRVSRFEGLIFDHSKHLKIDELPEDDEACRPCHGAVSEAKTLSKALAPRMETCMDCHEKEKASNECETCHANADDLKPQSHDDHWRRSHGASVLDLGGYQKAECATCHKSDFCSECHEKTPPSDHLVSFRVKTHGHEARFDDQRCETCHEKRECAACHRSQPPRDHTIAFSQKGHGLDAAIDRDRCMTCHRQDACLRCHETQPPRSHVRSQWGGTRSVHCLSCHEPLQNTECGVCHKSTLGHRAARATPGNPAHLTATDEGCRICHTPFKIQHLDNGGGCRGCHR